MIIHRKPHRVPGLNTTSTADISFMLLIFFLVTTSMDADKGMLRQLPPPSPPDQQQVSEVDKRLIMNYEITADNQLLLDGKTVSMESVGDSVRRFVNRVGNKHIIALNVDRDASYDEYFQLQNKIVAAYRAMREQEAHKRYGHDYQSCTPEQRGVINEDIPQRISENYEDERRQP